MSRAALLSCLGVSGWGPLHWWLRHDGEPQALWSRLGLAWRLAQADGAADPRASLLLASLVRSSTDLIPLVAAPLPPPWSGLIFRHRLVCRPGGRWLHLRSWQCRSAEVPWLCCGLERRLEADLLARWGAQAATGWTGVLPPQKDEADALRAMPVLASGRAAGHGGGCWP